MQLNRPGPIIHGIISSIYCIFEYSFYQDYMTNFETATANYNNDYSEIDYLEYVGENTIIKR